MFQQRADLYTVAYFLPDHETARYQVFVTLLIFCQFMASLVLSPFAKNIFRITDQSFLKLERNFLLIGLPLSILSMIALYVVVTLLYHFSFPLIFYGMGALYVYAAYAYLPQNYLLGKENKQLQVSLYSLLASGVNLLFSVLLIHKLGIIGALTAGLLSQIFLVALYHHKTLFHAKS